MSTAIPAGRPSRQDWRVSITASLADYIDAGSTVAAAASLALWVQYFQLPNGLVGALGALGAGGISTGLGALVGGRLGDLLGRKRVYTYDLLFYAFGVLLVVVAGTYWMLIAGFMIAGFAFGADVPTSWSLIAERAPNQARHRMMGLTFMFWNAGPIFTLALSFALTPLGILGARLVFLHLFIVALVTWALRRKITESARWTEARRVHTGSTAVRTLFQGKNLKNVLLLFVIYFGFNIVSGSLGSFFQPNIIKTIGATSQAESVGLSLLSFLAGLISAGLVYMPLADRVNSRILFGIGAGMEILAYVLFAAYGLNSVTALANVLLFGFGIGLGQEVFFRTWSAEVFPTMLRNTAQGLIWGVAKIGTGMFRFVVPALAASGFHSLTLMLLVPLTISAIVGLLYCPNNRGRDLNELEKGSSETLPAESAR